MRYGAAAALFAAMTMRGCRRRVQPTPAMAPLPSAMRRHFSFTRCRRADHSCQTVYADSCANALL